MHLSIILYLLCAFLTAGISVSLMEPLKNFFSANYKKELFQFLQVPRNSKSSYFTQPKEFKTELAFRERSSEIGMELFKLFDQDYSRFAKHCQPLMAEKENNRKEFHDFFWDPFAWIIQNHGPNFYDESIPLLESLTKLSTAEFAIRPFIERFPDKTLHQMLEWSRSSNIHLRRLSSEGSRPRLPWGMNLKVMISEPERASPILENLKNDPEPYVQKSVANHLNDQSRLNPEYFYDIVKSWNKNASSTTKWIIKHALRSEIKAGNEKALQLLNIEAFKHNYQLSLLDKPQLQHEFNFQLKLESRETESTAFIADIELTFPGKKTERTKVFKGWTGEIKGGQEVILQKKLSLKDNSVRKFYPGRFELSVLVNGKKGESLTFACS